MGKIKNKDLDFNVFEVKVRCSACGSEWVVPFMDIPEIRELLVKGQPTGQRCKECHTNNRPAYAVVCVEVV